MQCVNAICGATLLIKPLKPDLHPIIAGASSVHTAETIFQERPLLVKKSSKIFFTSMTFAVVISCLQKRNSSLISGPLTERTNALSWCKLATSVVSSSCMLNFVGLSLQICYYLTENVLTDVIYKAFNNVI